MKRARFSIISLTVIMVIAVFTISACSRLPGQGGTPAAGSQTGTVGTVTLSETVEASGSIEAAQDAALYWKTTGVVENVNVRPGDMVNDGDVLATLEETSVPANVLAARVDQITAQQALDNLSPTALAIAQATQKVVVAQDQVNTKQDRVDYLGTPARQADIEQAKATVLLAKIQLDKAWDRYKPFQNKAEDNPIRASLYNAWASANQKYDQAVRRLNNLQGTGVNELDRQLAQADLELAQANLVDAIQKMEELKAGADPQDVAAAEARLTAAQATLNTLSLTAPFSGEILVVDVQPGDLVSTNQAAITLADRQILHINALIDETDIANVQVGNPATVTLDAFPGIKLNGAVTFINPMGQNVQGNVKYEVRIELDPTEQPILLGATADVIIQTGEPHDALTVPVRAIQTDEKGEFVMVVNSDGSLERVDIVSSRLFGDQVVIAGNLQAGDRVAIPETSNEVLDRMNQMDQQ